MVCGGWGGGWFMMVLWFVLVIAFLYVIIRATGTKGNKNIKHSESALDILKSRYAKGELKPDEFEKMKKDIQ